MSTIRAFRDEDRFFDTCCNYVDNMNRSVTVSMSERESKREREREGERESWREGGRERERERCSLWISDYLMCVYCDVCVCVSTYMLSCFVSNR